MDPVDLVRLTHLMALTRGRPDVVIGLVDGPVALDHPDLAAVRVQASNHRDATCRQPASMSCGHGTFVAGILVGRGGSRAPGIAPDCTLFVHAIFPETPQLGRLPESTSSDLANAIVVCVDAGVSVLNVSAALTDAPTAGERVLTAALNYAVERRVIVVVAAGNQGGVGGTIITSHPWVIPVVGYTEHGRPMASTNLGRSTGASGLGAPAAGVSSVAASRDHVVSGGTSIAAPFVSGAAALLWSIFPRASAIDIRHALLSSTGRRRRSVVPPLLNAWAAYETLSAVIRGRSSEVRSFGRQATQKSVR